MELYELLSFNWFWKNAKLQWFKTINIAGEKLTEQELRNAVYTGTWVSDAKKYFSKSGCVASNIARANELLSICDESERVTYWSWAS